jgi:nicotinate-nucleotide pyrophosphorylase
MVLLDNMTPAQCGRFCSRGHCTRWFLVRCREVTLENVRTYADAGADLISTSVITQSAPRSTSFDLRRPVELREN